MLSKIYCLCFALLFAGCATPPPAITKATGAFPAGNGFVAVRVLTNSGAIDQALGLNNRWMVLAARDAAGKDHRLEADFTQAGRRGTQVFRGFLPEGRYELGDMSLMIKSVDLRDKGLVFDVKAGRITNLGSIVYQPTGNRGYVVIRSNKDDDMRAMIRDEYPLLSRNASGAELAFSGAETGRGGALAGTPAGAPLGLAGNTALGGAASGATVGLLMAISDKLAATKAIAAWDKTASAEARLMLAKSNTYALNSIQQLASGEVLAASNLGQVLLRDPSRGWVHFDVGDSRELTAIHARDRQNILVGGEEGALYSTNDGGLNWKQLRPPTAGSILDIGEYRGEILVLTQDIGEFVLSSTRDIENAKWTELKRLPIDLNMLISHVNVESVATIVDNKYIVVTPTRAVHVLDLDARTWRMATTPGWLRDVSAVSSQLLLASGSHRTAPHLSRDMGNTWTEMKDTCAGIYSRVVSIAMVDQEEGYMLCASNGAMVGSTGLKKTRDGGKTWQVLIKETEVLASQMFASRARILYVDILARIHASHDGGKTWTIDRDTR